MPLQNHQYIIELFGTVLRDPTGPNTGVNWAATSQAFINFTPLPAGAPVVNLPITTSTSAYQYNMTVKAGQTYFVDPTVAVGYSFASAAGNPNFASVIFPAVQTAPFDLSFLYDGTGYSDMVMPETVFDFPAGGVDAFTVTGIDPADGLDPADTTAFIYRIDLRRRRHVYWHADADHGAGRGGARTELAHLVGDRSVGLALAAAASTDVGCDYGPRPSPEAKEASHSAQNP